MGGNVSFILALHKIMKKVLNIIAKKIIRNCIYIFCKVVYRAEAEGVENIPKDEPVIFCGNHKSLLDPPLMLATSKQDNAVFIAKDELRKVFVIRLLAKVYSAIYVKRDEKDVTALKEILKVLKNKKSIVIFPEGTRNGIAKGERVKDGAAFFAIKSGIKVLPFGISGGDKPFKKVKIKYGKPIDFSKYTDCKDKEAIKEVTDTIMEKIFELT